MADRQLTEKLTSGEITDIKIGGTSTSRSAATLADIPVVIQNYNYVSETDILNIGATDTDLARLQLSGQPTGTYEVKLSLTYTFASTSKSAVFRFSLDAGVNWEEFSKEPKDTSDREALSYFFPLSTGGTIDVWLQGRKTGGTGALDVKFANIIVEQKA